MQTTSVPRLGPIYWLTLFSASIFGTNTGDILSHTWHLGDDRGLPYLAVAFAAVLLAERQVPVANTLCYWLAVILLRTAATNLADLGTLQLTLDYQSFILALAALLALVLLLSGRIPGLGVARRRAAMPGIPSTDATYWLAMLLAATLGTALGDFGSHTITLRACAALSTALFAGAFWLVRRTVADTPLYWCTIVLARMAGTNLGDLLAFKKGLNLGLPLSTLCTGLVFFGFVLAGNRLQIGAVPRRA